VIGLRRGVVVVSACVLVLMACGHRDEWTTVPSNATFGLQLALERLEEADLRFEISSFPPLPCGIAIESYHVVLQDPRALSMCLAGIPPLPGEASHRGLDAFVVETQDPPAETRVPYRRMIRVTLAIG
jgi:hypothetical protein